MYIGKGTSGSLPILFAFRPLHATADATDPPANAHVSSDSCQPCQAIQWLQHKLYWDVQVWLQEFAWTEQDEAIKLAARKMTLPPSEKKHPLFCFETMMHMLYWSCLVYDHKRVCLC